MYTDSKKAMELPVNIVVMLIIGIILFGVGISLFSQFIGAGDEQIDNWRGEVIKKLAKIECSGDNWICAPTVKMGLSDKQSSYIYVVNRDDTQQDYSINITSSSMSSTRDGAKKIFEKNDECGSIIVAPYPGDITIESGNSAGFPIQILTSRVIREGCSFTLLAEIEQENENTPLIINVD